MIAINTGRAPIKMVAAGIATALLASYVSIVGTATSAHAEVAAETSSDGLVTTVEAPDEVKFIVTRQLDGTGHGTPNQSTITTANGWVIGDDEPLDGVVSTNDNVVYNVDVEFTASPSARTYTIAMADMSLAFVGSSCGNGINVKGSFSGSKCTLQVPAGVTESLSFTVTGRASFGGFVDHAPMLRFTGVGSQNFIDTPLGELTFVSAPFLDVDASGTRNATVDTTRDPEGVTGVLLRWATYQVKPDSVRPNVADFVGKLDVSNFPDNWVYRSGTVSNPGDELTPVEGKLDISGLSEVVVQIPNAPDPAVSGTHSYDFFIEVDETAYQVASGNSYYPEGIKNNETGTQPGTGLARDQTTRNVIGASRAGSPYPNNDWGVMRVTRSEEGVPPCANPGSSYCTFYTPIDIYRPSGGMWDISSRTFEGSGWSVLISEEREVPVRTSVDYAIAPEQAMWAAAGTLADSVNNEVRKVSFSWDPELVEYDPSRVAHFGLSNRPASNHSDTATVTFYDADGAVVTSPADAVKATVSESRDEWAGVNHVAGFIPLKVKSGVTSGSFVLNAEISPHHNAEARGSAHRITIVPPPALMTVTVEAPSEQLTVSGTKTSRNIVTHLGGSAVTIDTSGVTITGELSVGACVSDVEIHPSSPWEIEEVIEGTACDFVGEHVPTVYKLKSTYERVSDIPGQSGGSYQYGSPRSRVISLNVTMSVPYSIKSLNAPYGRWQFDVNVQQSTSETPLTASIYRDLRVTASSAAGASIELVNKGPAAAFVGEEFVVRAQALSKAANASTISTVIAVPRAGDKDEYTAARGYTDSTSAVTATSSDDYQLLDVEFNSVHTSQIDHVYYTTSETFSFDAAVTDGWLPFTDDVDLSTVTAFKVEASSPALGANPGRVISPAIVVDLLMRSVDGVVDDAFTTWMGPTRVGTTSNTTVRVASPRPLTVTLFDFLVQGYVWENNDSLRQWQEGEPGFEGVTVEFHSDSGPVLTTTTDDKGYFSFYNPPRGKGTVVVIEEGKLALGQTTSTDVGSRWVTRVNSLDLSSRFNTTTQSLLSAPTAIYRMNAASTNSADMYVVKGGNMYDWYSTPSSTSSNPVILDFGYQVEEASEASATLDVGLARIVDETESESVVEWDVVVTNNNSASIPGGQVVTTISQGTGEADTTRRKAIVANKPLTNSAYTGSSILIDEDGKLFYRGVERMNPASEESDYQVPTNGYVPIEGPEGVSFVDAGASTSGDLGYGITSDGDLYIWGPYMSSSYLLPYDESYPEERNRQMNKVTTPAAGVSVVQANGSSSLIVLDKEGAMYSYGSSWNNEDRGVPVRVEPELTFTQPKDLKGRGMYVGSDNNLYTVSSWGSVTQIIDGSVADGALTGFKPSGQSDPFSAVKSDKGTPYFLNRLPNGTYSLVGIELPDGSVVKDAVSSGQDQIALTVEGDLWVRSPWTIGSGAYSAGWTRVAIGTGMVRIESVSGVGFPMLMDEDNYLYGLSTYSWTHTNWTIDDFKRLIDEPVELLIPQSSDVMVFGRSGKLYASVRNNPTSLPGGKSAEFDITVNDESEPWETYGWTFDMGPVYDVSFDLDTIEFAVLPSLYDVRGVEGVSAVDTNGVAWNISTSTYYAGTFLGVTPGDADVPVRTIVGEPVFGNADYMRGNVPVDMLRPGETRTVSVRATVPKVKGEAQVVGLQAYFTADLLPIADLMPDDLMAPLPMVLPALEDVDLQGITGNASCNADPEQTTEDRCDQVPAIIAPAALDNVDVTIVAFNDLNGNGVQDEGEFFIDGVDVAYTAGDDEGVYTTGRISPLNIEERTLLEIGAITPPAIADGTSAWRVRPDWSFAQAVNEPLVVVIPLAEVKPALSVEITPDSPELKLDDEGNVTPTKVTVVITNTGDEPLERDDVETNIVGVEQCLPEELMPEQIVTCEGTTPAMAPGEVLVLNYLATSTGVWTSIPVSGGDTSTVTANEPEPVVEEPGDPEPDPETTPGPPETTPPPTTTPNNPEPEMPRTGSETQDLVGYGLILVALGLATLVGAKGVRSRKESTK